MPAAQSSQGSEKSLVDLLAPQPREHSGVATPSWRIGEMPRKQRKTKSTLSVPPWLVLGTVVLLILSLLVGYLELHQFSSNTLNSPIATPEPSSSPIATPNPTPNPINDSLASAALERGIAHLEVRAYNLAIEDFTQAIGLKPDFAQALL